MSRDGKGASAHRSSEGENMNVGKVVQVIGPTVDVLFDPDKLPPILNAIRIDDEKAGITKELLDIVGGAEALK